MITLLNELLVVFIILQAADFWTTKKVLDAGGYEANKIVKRVMDKLGEIPGLLASKAFGAAMGIGLWYLQEPEMLGAVTIAYVLVVVNNYRVLRKIR